MTEMKESGIEWIGKIPKDWGLIPFGYLLLERSENNNPVKTDERLSLSIDKGVTLFAEKTTNLDRYKDDVSQYKITHVGDFVMNSMNMIVGAVGISNYFGCVSPAYYTFYDNEDDSCYCKYCDYLFHTQALKQVLFSLGKGIMAIDKGEGRVNTCRLKVSRYDLKKIILPLPSQTEIRKIIKFLDKKCAEIDTLYIDIQKQIEILEEYKKSIITEAVTKGLDPDVEMKDSGIEWIKKIPKHWKTNKIKYLFTSGKGLSITKENLMDEGLPVISYGQIHAKTNSGVDINEDLLRFVSYEYQKRNPNCEVKKYDFIFADTSEDYEGCGNCVYKRDDSLLFAYHKSKR